MRLLNNLTSTIGAARRLRAFGRGDRLAAVGRWGHGGARFDLTDIDTMQLIFNVSGGHLVEVQSGGHCVRNKIRAGSVATTSPGNPAIVTVTGAADILQISIAPGLIESITGQSASPTLPAFAACDARLQACAVQALVGLSRDQGDSRADFNRIVRRVSWLFAQPAAAPATPAAARGGLSTAARRRVHALIAQRLEAAPWTSPSLDELAATANLSVFHFVRAFRQSEGQPPHAHILARRVDKALNLLLQADMRVDEVGELTGFGSSAHFVSTFRKHMGVSPGTIRDAAHAENRKIPIPHRS